jgi:hypothetical protein
MKATSGGTSSSAKLSSTRRIPCLVKWLLQSDGADFSASLSERVSENELPVLRLSTGREKDLNQLRKSGIEVETVPSFVPGKAAQFVEYEYTTAHPFPVRSVSCPSEHSLARFHCDHRRGKRESATRQINFSSQHAHHRAHPSQNRIYRAGFRNTEPRGQSGSTLGFQGQGGRN